MILSHQIKQLSESSPKPDNEQIMELDRSHSSGNKAKHWIALALYAAVAF
jgi:hypothetical protein